MTLKFAEKCIDCVHIYIYILQFLCHVMLVQSVNSTMCSMCSMWHTHGTRRENHEYIRGFDLLMPTQLAEESNSLTFCPLANRIEYLINADILKLDVYKQ